MMGWVLRTFSHALLCIYTLVIFQHGVIDGIHFLSHATEILSDNYAFHSHGKGSFHVHHHDFMDTVKTILHQDEKSNHQKEDQLPGQQKEINLHLPEYFNAQLNVLPKKSIHTGSLFVGLIPISLDVLTPPPKASLPLL
jgi:hypothetical protein